VNDTVSVCIYERKKERESEYETARMCNSVCENETETGRVRCAEIV